VSAEAGADERPQLSRLTKLLPIAVIAAAICLFASELMTMFEFRPPGGEAFCAQDAGDRHSNAQMVVAVFSVIAVLVAIYGGSRPAAFAVAAMGVLALLIFLISDLRVAGATGQLSEDCGGFLLGAEAIPQGGFYLELAGALALAVSGIALATLTPQQLSALRPSGRGRRSDGPSSEATDEDPAAHGERKEGRLSRLSRRPRSRQREERERG